LQLGQTIYLAFAERKLTGKAYDTDYGVGNKERGMEIKAVLREIVPDLSEPADIRRTVWAVDNRARLLEPMLYTGVTMRTGQSYEALTVPLAAMIDKAHDKVFVLDAEGIIHLRTVKAGADDKKYIEIYDGLVEGDTVIVGNLDGLEDGMKVDAEVEGDN
jgi:hypothetical protein